MDRIHFSTVVSCKYIFKFVVMYQSLIYHYDNFHIYVLCIDDWTFRILSAINFDKVTLLGLEDIENEDLKRVRKQRIFHEYAWTVKPAVLYYVMTNFPSALYFAHIDADLCFFSSPFDLFSENPNAKLFLTKHHYSHMFSNHIDGGIYNTGFVGCSSQPEAYQAIAWWRKKCIEDCPLKINKEKQIYGDQRYVEDWETLFGGVHVVQSKGANVAVWNIDSYGLSIRDEELYVNDDKLIFYHFSHFSIYDKRAFNLTNFHKLSDQVIQFIYTPYMILISKAIENIHRICPEFKDGYVSHHRRSGNQYHEI
ncbi:hypothetical protein HNQ80_000892 [Anaerosolibacter carboniphilus]|uniref:Nucleotide-diphospho-sugar transferase n=1 Tax=Anaerosolibacter carboniphilus TaxID=1417629 RepID=A0A841KMY8_9FIRM|nr:hypothetical protein [Anaerosolibacter carboniphilus]MBB6214807.1 hypothetical protein [Anaerosolibacter carboniphilus]